MGGSLGGEVASELLRVSGLPREGEYVGQTASQRLLCRKGKQCLENVNIASALLNFSRPRRILMPFWLDRELTRERKNLLEAAAVWEGGPQRVNKPHITNLEMCYLRKAAVGY